MKECRNGETKANIPTSIVSVPLGDETRRNMAIAQRIRRGMPMSEATKLKISLTKRGESNPMFGTISPRRRVFADREEFLRLRNQKNLSLSELATRYGVCVTTVHNWLRKFGIKCTEEERLQRISSKRAWNYRGVKDTYGYVMKESPNHPCSNKAGYVFEHRLVVEAAIGRLLFPEERVHHLNHQRQDNQIDNLLLLPTGSAHTLFHHWTGMVGAYALGYSLDAPTPFSCGSAVFFRGKWVQEVQCTEVKSIASRVA